MKKFVSLLKASTKGQLNLFKFKRVSKFNSILVIGLSIMLLGSSYAYSELIADPLHKVGLAYIAISLFAFCIVILLMIEGIYKSQGIIFDAKDNDMLFSMPIKKSYILISRFLKILFFNYMLQFIFLVPCIVKYSILVKPNMTFYLLSILFFILLPLIPLVISCVIGYIIKAISIRFRNKKLVQTTITILFFLGIMFISFSMEGIVNNVVAKANSLNDLISKIYLPIGLYIELINDFSLIKLIELILISIVPFVLFVIIFSYNYDKIINYGKENSSKSKNKANIRSNSIIKSLIKKEMKTYFGIPPYIINTIISPLLMLLMSFFLIVKFDYFVNAITSTIPSLSMASIYKLSPYLFIGIVLILLSLSTITASSISLEGSKHSLLKSLPVKENSIFLSKILLNDIIMIPAFLIGAVIYIMKFEIFSYNIILILFSCIILPHINGQLGLLINLMFPKLNFNSEVEVVKQSMAVFVAMIVNLIFALLIIYSFYKLMSIVNNLLLSGIYMVILMTIMFVLNKILNSYGVKRFRAID